MALSLEGMALQASLTVKDLEKSVAWYTGALGFAISRRIERDGKLRGVAIQTGAVRLILNQDDGAKGWDRAKGLGMSFQITTQQDVDRLADQVRSYGSPLDTELTDTPWGARIFRVRDPDGFRWTISRPQVA